MKTAYLAALSAALLVAGCSGPTEPDVSATSPATTPSMTGKAQPAKTATASGTITAIDADAGKITIAHEPVTELAWPAMTMAFKASPEQIAGVNAGQKVQFEFETQGMDATITRISAVP